MPGAYRSRGPHVAYQPIKDVEAGGPEPERDAEGGAAREDDAGKRNEEAKKELDKLEDKDRVLGPWKNKLADLNQAAYPEEKLHDVQWSWLALEFVTNALFLALFIGFVFLYDVSTLFSLPVFLLTAVLVVLAYETLSESRPEQRFIGVFVLVVMVVLGVATFRPWYFLQLVSMFLPIVLLFFLLVAEAATKEFGGIGLVRKTHLWQSLSGFKRITLHTEVEVAAFFKAIEYKKALTWRAQLANRFYDITVNLKLESALPSSLQISQRKKESIVVEMVDVEESAKDVPKVPLICGEEELDPSTWVVFSLSRRNVRQAHRKASEKGEELQITSLENSMSESSRVSDIRLNSWLNPGQQTGTRASESTEGMGADQSISALADCRVGEWVSKFRPNETELCVVLERLKYWDGIFDHWAFRALWCTVWCCVIVLPTLYLHMAIDDERTHVCQFSKDHNLTIVGARTMRNTSTTLCGDPDGDLMSCDEACNSYITFIKAVHHVLHLSTVELGFVFVLLPLFMFTQAVLAVRRDHNVDELIFLRRLRQPKKAVHEVMSAKVLMEESFSFAVLMSRFLSAFGAWRGADENLDACGPISPIEFDFTEAKSANPFFKAVAAPISALTSSLSYDEGDNWCSGVGVLTSWPSETREKYISNLESDWKHMQAKHRIGATSDRNFKIMFDLSIRNAASWRHFRTWIHDHYSVQLKEIVENQKDKDAQDLGKGCHLKEDTIIDHIKLPKGLSFTHIFVGHSPSDGKPRQIPVRSYPGGVDEFWQKCESMKDKITNARATHKEEKQLGRGDWHDEVYKEKLLDFRLQRHPIVARFALSEQYFDLIPEDALKQLVPDPSSDAPKSGDDPTSVSRSWSAKSFTSIKSDILGPGTVRDQISFSNFVDRLLKPREDPFNAEQVPDGEEYSFQVRFSVLMGDREPFQALLAAARSCALAGSIPCQCAALAMAIPIIRIYSGGNAFPDPFFYHCLFGAVGNWYLLNVFFGNFSMASKRLSIVLECLAKLKDKTSDPVQRVSAPSTQAEGSGGKSEGKESARGQESNADSYDDPCDLFLGEVPETYQPYQPGEGFWKNEWQKRHDNVNNWNLSVRYLRIFVSTARLTAQTMLAASGVVVIILLAVSLIQMMVAGDVDVGGLARAHAAVQQVASVASSGDAASRRLHFHVADTLAALSQDRRLHEIPVAASAATLSESKVLSLSAAVKAKAPDPLLVDRSVDALAASLSPARAALYSALLRQHFELEEGQRRLQEHTDMSAGMHAVREVLEDPDKVRRQQGSASQGAEMHTVMRRHVLKATKTQIFTVLMVIFVMLTSVPLMWKIVALNWHFDFHQDLLLHIEDDHRKYQGKRNWRRSLPAAVQQKRNGATTLPRPLGLGGGSASTEAEQAGGQGSHVAPQDMECHLYEQMLGKAIKSAKQARERFPFKLFGFVISYHLLSTWIVAGSTPLVSQGKELGPPMAMVACTWLEHCKMVEHIQKEIDSLHSETKFNVSGLIHDNLCIPLKKTVEGLVQGKSLGPAKALLQKVSNETHKHPAARRLLASMPSDGGHFGRACRSKGRGSDLSVMAACNSTALLEIVIPDLHAVTEQWWQSTPDVSPGMKLSIARRLLLDLDRNGQRLLAHLPAQVAESFQHQAVERRDPMTAFVSSLSTLRALTHVALLDLTKDEEDATSGLGDSHPFGNGMGTNEEL